MKKIGVFDSGVGGLTVVKEIRKHFPHLDIIYLGDTARLPYGDKSESTIIDYSISNTKFLLNYDVDLIVVACNTSSAIALETLEKKFCTTPFVGMIKAGATLALKMTKFKRIGLIGTRATIMSGAYKKELLKMNEDVEVFEKATPLFVPLVEEGFAEDEVSFIVAKKYLLPLLEKRIDTLILGCTHYPLLIPTIKKIAPDVSLISSGRATVEFLKENLAIKAHNKKGSLEVFVTDITTHFKEVAERLLGEKINLEHISYEGMNGNEN
jgi:glutamate racemase